MDYSVTNERIFNWMIEKNSELNSMKYKQGVITFQNRNIDVSDFDMKTMFSDDNSFSEELDKLSCIDVFNILSIYSSLDALEKIEPLFFKTLSED